LHGKHIITVLLALLVLVPVSVSYAGNQRVEKFIELAEKARDKTETLINITTANTTAMDDIEDAYLDDEFEANVTLFNEAALNITTYQDVANLTLALGVFRDVYKSINRILVESNVERGQLIDAQGLIQVYKRALRRIDRLEEIDDLPVEVEWLLGNATLHLNVTLAIEWLQQGMVNQTAHNKTMANRYISEAYKTLKKTAAEMNTKRIENYFKTLNKFQERLSRQIGKLDNPSELDIAMGAVDTLLGEAQDYFDNQQYPEGHEKLEQARNALEEVEEDLKLQRRAEKGKGNGGS